MKNLSRFCGLPILGLLACGGPTPANVPVNDKPAPSDAVVDAGAPTADTTDAGLPAKPADPTPPSTPTRVPSTLAGTLLGKPFKGVIGCIIGWPKNGFVFLEVFDVADLDETKSCALPETPGARKVGVLVEWKDGAKTDASKLKSGKNPEGWIMEVTPQKKFVRKDFGKEYKPKGQIEVLRAPTKGNEYGRIKVTLASGADKLDGEVDVYLRTDLHQAWGP